MSTQDSILVVTNLVKEYSTTAAVKRAVDDVSFRVAAGSFFGLLGPNGAGKSTTIGCITGTHIITSGQIMVNGYDVVGEYRAARRQIGLSSQEYNINPFESVRQLISFMGGYYGLSWQARRERVDMLLTQLQLTDHADKIFKDLSGGLKRRVVLARALVHQPPLLILDEPTAGIDVEQRHAVWALLTDLNKQGVSIIMTSHYLEEIERLCDRVAIINHGRIVSDQPIAAYQEAGRTLEEAYLTITGAEGAVHRAIDL